MSDDLDRLRAALADRYQIERELGSGGMATVYVAHDLRHRRRVAVKVLRPDLAAALGADRFLREIEIAAQLQHPHILTLIDSGEADGLLYYVMPYVEGESLRTRLAREGELPIPEAVRLIREVVDALAHAHQRGVVHRDIKPDNVLLTGRHATVTDFGVAKAVSEATGRQQLTTAGVALGTPAYMAPEQAVADPNIDHRADIYAVGVMAYEMLSGRPPFTGTTPQQVLSAHVTEAPVPVTTHRGTVPPALGQVVMKCLQKKPADRWQSAEELLHQLEGMVTPSGGMEPTAATAASISARRGPSRWLVGTVAVATVLAVAAITGLIERSGGGAGAASELPMLVVLPLENLGPPDDDYFAAGITEAITTRLAGLGELGVISRQSAGRYEDSDKSVREIAEELGVQYVLEGTIQRERPMDPASRVRVNPQLIRASDDIHLWAQAFDVEMTEVFQVYSKIAEAVAQALDVTLVQRETETLRKRPTDNVEAYDAYLRANAYMSLGFMSPQDLRAAEELYTRAVQLDPAFAEAYARLANAHLRMFWFFWDRTPQRVSLAKQAIDQAFALRPDLPEAHLALGNYHYWGSRNYARALAEYAAAQRLRPNDAELFDAIANVQRRLGNWEQSLASRQPALELDPQNVRLLTDVGTTHFWMRNYAEAERYWNRSIAAAPDVIDAYLLRSLLYVVWLGDLERARAGLAEAGDRLGITAVVTAFLQNVQTVDFFCCVPEGFHRELDRFSLATVRADPAHYYRGKAISNQARGREDAARAYHDSARIVLEGRVQRQPDEARFHSLLGRTYAALGRSEDAIRHGSRAVELMPVSRDAAVGPQMLGTLASVYATAGEADRALDIVEELLTVPAGWSKPFLRLLADVDPGWASLRDHPRFQELAREGS
ncbi:MAG: protein kinase [Gemmatimonadales bacterium]|nr:protein kinase [Gemmatimonadales bacterium]NIN11771.1 protein kinase [Gemmatimonadales bacterium]NIN50327.1 protein kinase [Gemmatimonadales bacterium]NIP07791.1 protein kinase [Gemmatimonadales bacterium]NIQ99223.1 protein kinase [Gemmatimonadales bacterium]